MAEINKLFGLYPASRTGGNIGGQFETRDEHPSGIDPEHAFRVVEEEILFAVKNGDYKDHPLLADVEIRSAASNCDSSNAPSR